ncbi:site-specific integrase [Sphingomonas sp.]|uniref:tyrosine-type recombinase/integrase n=1 Tax=Sphingomonas sp. TaxID=28214 RepID=UPI001B03A680|nr:site-specific integrase [Sphingomonas sp.]MBO9712643.1 site-specific integrase [Sphingomonas sp.]
MITDGAQLLDINGQRKYLHAREAKRLLAAAARADRETRLFCHLLYYTGCRVSEGLALTPRLLDTELARVVFRTLKRRKLVHRAVPLPAPFLRELAELAKHRALDERLFPWSRSTGWRRIKALMDAAGIDGPQATPKGLRHHFGVHAIGCKMAESSVGRWLGHAEPKSTYIYTAALGDEERALVRRMWKER